MGGWENSETKFPCNWHALELQEYPIRASKTRVPLNQKSAGRGGSHRL